MAVKSPPPVPVDRPMLYATVRAAAVPPVRDRVKVRASPAVTSGKALMLTVGSADTVRVNLSVAVRPPSEAVTVML